MIAQSTKLKMVRPRLDHPDHPEAPVYIHKSTDSDIGPVMSSDSNGNYISDHESRVSFPTGSEADLPSGAEMIDE